MPRIMGLVSIIVGAIAIVVGAAVYIVVHETLAAEKITVSSDAPFLAGRRTSPPEELDLRDRAAAPSETATRVAT